MTTHFQQDDSLPVAVPEAFVSLVATVSDIAIITDRGGKILDIIWNVPVPDGFDPRSLVGQRLDRIVTEECRPKISQMLRQAGLTESPKWREINHDVEGLQQFPIRYQAVPAGDQVIFLGHEMQAVAALQSRLIEAQRALDQDYGRLRQLETRYRVLFQTSSEALLIVDAKTRRVQEANAVASRLLDRQPDEITGRTFESLFADADRQMIRDNFEGVAATGTTADFTGRLGGSEMALDGRIAVFRADETVLVLCSLGRGVEPRTATASVEQMLIGVVDRIPDALVLTNAEGHILWCNDAFLAMSEIALPQQAEGEDLDRFIGRPGVDIGVILSNVLEQGRLRAFSAVVVGAFGSETRVEISVAAVAESDPPAIGFVIRDVSRYDRVPAARTPSSSEPVENWMDLVGTVPLKELVRASTEEIERMCIETALRKTGNNRASAAEMLGLSRQSLYVKLRRFGLLDWGE